MLLEKCIYLTIIRIAYTPIKVITDCIAWNFTKLFSFSNAKKTILIAILEHNIIKPQYSLLSPEMFCSGFDYP
jgi:hypothetical protein